MRYKIKYLELSKFYYILLPLCGDSFELNHYVVMEDKSQQFFATKYFFIKILQQNIEMKDY